MKSLPLSATSAIEAIEELLVDNINKGSSLSSITSHVTMAIKEDIIISGQAKAMANLAVHLVIVKYYLSHKHIEPSGLYDVFYIDLPLGTILDHAAIVLKRYGTGELPTGHVFNMLSHDYIKALKRAYTYKRKEIKWQS